MAQQCHGSGCRRLYEKVRWVVSSRKEMTAAFQCPCGDSCGFVSKGVLWSDGKRMVYLSEQYRTKLLGTMICFSQVVLRKDVLAKAIAKWVP